MKRTPTIILGICSLLFYSASCSKLTMEHDEARNLEIQTIDFTELKRGEFTGYYAGGMYQWRENECLVIAEYQKLVHIQLLQSAAEYTSEFLDTQYQRVIDHQSLQVDAVSGSTLDSRACLKAIENALIKATR